MKAHLRTALVDHLVLLALLGIALSGLSATYTGVGWWVAGLVGAVVGVGVVVLASVRGWPAIASPLLGLVAFLALGPTVALSGVGLWWPGPESLTTLVDQVVFGPKDLLTTVPPVDGAGELRVLPWSIGVVAGLLGAASLRLPIGPPLMRAVAPTLAPILTWAVALALGTLRPASLALQGAIFAVVTLGWMAVRTARESVAVRGGAGRVRSRVAGIALVGVAGTVAFGAVASGDDTDDAGRVVLRTYVQPPFDIGQYPSPLASFRRYVEQPEPDAQNLFDETLFTVTGAPPESRVRIAALDSYDGVVWGAANDTIPSVDTDAFQRVSPVIDNPATGERADIEITLADGYSGVWLPTVGALQTLRLPTETQQEEFRYNRATRTAVVPPGLSAGDTYRFSTIVDNEPLTPTDVPSPDILDASFGASFLTTQSREWSDGEARPMARVFAIADYLRQEGKYSDGVAEAEKIYRPGHHVRRLGPEFANAPIIAGNDEQYAATMALLANAVGAPARVVLGAVVPETGEVRGQDVSAWVEVQTADGAWRTLDTSVFMDFDKPAEQPPLTEQEQSGTVVPPPAPIPPPSELDDQRDTDLRARDLADEDDDEESGIAGWPAWLRWLVLATAGPLALWLVLAGAVVGIKALRRRLRSRRGPALGRVAGGWREVTDQTRDLGTPVPGRSGLTRREQADLLVLPDGARVVARRADGVIFGPGEPDDDVAEEFWTLVNAHRAKVRGQFSRVRRFRAAITPRSLLPYRRERGVRTSSL